MRNIYLLDTNIIIYYFNGLTNDEDLLEILASSFNISIITKIEFLSWSKFSTDLELQQKARKFISYAKVFELNEDIANQTIANRQKYKIKTPDAIIAATAQVHNFKLVTNNTADFESLELTLKNITLKTNQK